MKSITRTPNARLSNFQSLSENSLAAPKTEMNGRAARGFGADDDDDDRGFLWRLPVVKSKRLGKLGPGFGVGAGCGVGFGVGLLGGAGIGPGIPGLQIGFGIGAGCGVGLGFGYGAGRGIAYDEYRKYSNVGSLFQGQRSLPSQDEISAVFDELVISTKKLIHVTTKEIDKWRR